jgi:hypothetical protein
MKRLLGTLLVLLSTFCAATCLQAQNEITSVPYTIKYPGVYVLTKDLTYLPQEGTAITILCGNVLLDFRGHTLTNPYTSWTSDSNAIWARGVGLNNVGILNGKISGFENGIIFGTVGANGRPAFNQFNTVAGMTLSNQLSLGILEASAVVNCSVLETGISVEGNFDANEELGDPLAIDTAALVENCTVSTADGCALFYYYAQPHGPFLAINCRLSGYELIENAGVETVLAIHDHFLTQGATSIIGNVTIIPPAGTGSFSHKISWVK